MKMYHSNSTLYQLASKKNKFSKNLKATPPPNFDPTLPNGTSDMCSPLSRQKQRSGEAFEQKRAFESSVEALERNVDQKFPLTKAESNWFGERVPNVPLAHDNLERHCFTNFGFRIHQPNDPYIFADFFNCQESFNSPNHLSYISTFSSLNPNAKVFTPLNPNAKEFTPLKLRPTHDINGKKVANCEVQAEEDDCPKVVIQKDETLAARSKPEDDRTSENTCITPTIVDTLSMRATSDHLKTPFVKTLNSDEINCDLDKSETEDDSNDDLFGIGVYDDSEEEDLGKENQRLSESSGDDKSSGRYRSLSVCSDSSFIEFSASSPGGQPTVTIEKGAVWHLTDSDDESVEEEPEEVGGWDEVDQNDEDEIDFNEKMIILGFIHPLFVHQTHSISSRRMVISNVQTVRNFPEQDMYPSKASSEEIEKRIQEANSTWEQNYKGSCSSDNFQKATFSSPDTWVYIDEDPLLIEDLRESRVNDLLRRKADLDRMERLLAPILDQSHREKVWSKIHTKQGQELHENNKSISCQ